MFFPVYFAFALPSTVLFAAKIFYIGGSVYYLAGSLVIAYFIEITSIVFSTQDSFRKDAETRFSNNKLMQEVITQKETAEHAILAKNQFLAAASHDLRQPLHAQGLFINAIKDQDLSTDAHEIVSKIQLSNDALNGLLNSLLDISKLDADSVSNSPTNIALKPIIRNITQEYSERASQNNTKIIMDVATDISVYCDEGLLYRLIRNIIDNAVKFTIDGTITVSCKSRYNEVTLSISDTGRGIPKDQLENVFEEFTQLDNPERDRQKGLGLGLAIVQRLSKLMEIQMSVQSEVNIGTTFLFKVPSSISSSIDIKQKTLQTTEHKRPQSFFENQVILVIDDEVDILDGMEHLVETWQATIITANDAEMAIDKLDSLNITPTLLLCDLI